MNSGSGIHTFFAIITVMVWFALGQDHGLGQICVTEVPQNKMIYVVPVENVKTVDFTQESTTALCLFICHCMYVSSWLLSQLLQPLDVMS